MAAYYNEIEPYAAEWLRNLIMLGHIADGEVDTRSISDVEPNDLREFDQCHFFAGIGVWSHALRLAGWPDDRPVWTGSCPCQPFSSAGRGEGFADERHLWPHWHHLIYERRPGVVFGEQVASKDGLDWLDLVHTDLEATGYASAAFDLCAAGVGAPHIRQRLWFVAEWMEHAGNDGRERDERVRGPGQAHGTAEATRGEAPQRQRSGATDRSGGAFGGMADDDEDGREQLAPSRLHGRRDGSSGGEPEQGEADRARGHNADGCGEHGRPGPTNGHWRDADWLGCRDGKWRPIEPGTSALAVGTHARVGRLRAYGNAIVAPLAAEVIAAFMECRP